MGGALADHLLGALVSQRPQIDTVQQFLAGAELPAPLEAATSRLAEVVPPVTEDRSLAGDVERVRDLVLSGRLIGGVRSPTVWS